MFLVCDKRKCATCIDLDTCIVSCDSSCSVCGIDGKCSSCPIGSYLRLPEKSCISCPKNCFACDPLNPEKCTQC